MRAFYLNIACRLCFFVLLVHTFGFYAYTYLPPACERNRECLGSYALLLCAAIFTAISATRPRADVAYCIHALARRLSKTHNWAVSVA